MLLSIFSRLGLIIYLPVMLLYMDIFISPKIKILGIRFWMFVGGEFICPCFLFIHRLRILLKYAKFRRHLSMVSGSWSAQLRISQGPAILVV